jgi:predicted DNA-binding transcriptional regulator
MIHDDFFFRDLFCWDDPGLSLRNMGLIKELRIFQKSVRERLAELEKEPVSNKELIMQEKAISEAIQKEIRRLEKQSFYFQFGPG